MSCSDDVDEDNAAEPVSVYFRGVVPCRAGNSSSSAIPGEASFLCYTMDFSEGKHEDDYDDYHDDDDEHGLV